MDDASDTLDMKRRAKVAAAIDLEGVPAGTPGQIMYVAGFSWKRARVRFANGVERGSLDGRHLVSRAVWQERELELARQHAREENKRMADELRAKLITGGAH